ncbi:sulfatase [Armatimonas sp.]|uniref:sulfatase family protein n=1 Tax=Armatimonas sp. TaxID=1872638 RepID=UPI0037517FA7
MNIVFIALDTQRADHLGCYGYEKNTSPIIDALAAQGVVFERCYAPNIPTHPSFTTMLTGKEAITHNIVNIGGRVPIEPGVKLLPEILKEHGWNTAAIDTMGRHFNRGFDTYISPQWDRSDPLTLRRAEHITDAALPVLEQLKADKETPFFLFLHYWDPHTPYLPPADFRTMFYPKDADPYDVNNHSMDKAWNDEMFQWYFHDWMPGVTDSSYVNALFDAETAYMDWQLRRLFAALEPIKDDTLIVITADHGEILDEQLGFYDHHGLYEGNVHIPLILIWPGKLPAGKRVSGFVQNLDYLPTFFELAGIPDTEKLNLEGKSLLPCIFGERDGNYDELFLSEATWEVKRAYRNNKWKFIHSFEPDPHNRPLQELFDLVADPTEQVNLAEEHPEIVAELKGRLDAWVTKRLAETGRIEDPVPAQGRCGSKIGTPIEGETPGAGATPLHLRKAKEAANIPKPEELNAAVDQKSGRPLHGYVEKPPTP